MSKEIIVQKNSVIKKAKIVFKLPENTFPPDPELVTDFANNTATFLKEAFPDTEYQSFTIYCVLH